MRLPVNKLLVGDSVTFTALGGKTNDYGDPEYGEPVTINNCRLQLQTVYTGTNDQRQLIANAVIFLYADLTKPWQTFSKDSLGSVFTYRGVDYTLVSITELMQPGTNDLYGYELQVK